MGGTQRPKARTQDRFRLGSVPGQDRLPGRGRVCYQSASPSMGRDEPLRPRKRPAAAQIGLSAALTPGVTKRAKTVQLTPQPVGMPLNEILDLQIRQASRCQHHHLAIDRDPHGQATPRGTAPQ